MRLSDGASLPMNAQDRRQNDLTFFSEFDDVPVQRLLACIFCHIFVSLYTVSQTRQKIKQKNLESLLRAPLFHEQEAWYPVKKTRSVLGGSVGKGTNMEGIPQCLHSVKRLNVCESFLQAHMAVDAFTSHFLEYYRQAEKLLACTDFTHILTSAN